MSATLTEPAPATERPATSAPTSEDARVPLRMVGGPADGHLFSARPRHTGTTVPPWRVLLMETTPLGMCGDILTPVDAHDVTTEYVLDRPDTDPGSWVFVPASALRLPAEVAADTASRTLTALAPDGTPVNLLLCLHQDCPHPRGPDGHHSTWADGWMLTGGQPAALEHLRRTLVAHAITAAHTGAYSWGITHADVVQLLDRIDAVTGRTGERG